MEDHIRYSGENGIRFHRMVVRKLVRALSPALSAAPATADADFRPAEIAANQIAYLNNYERANDRFGEIHFLTKDIPIQPHHLAVVAWIEDPTTHEILNAAYTGAP